MTGERTFHFVRISEVPDWLLCGWLARPSLNGTGHGEWSVLCEWLCDCKMPRPGRTPENQVTKFAEAV